MREEEREERRIFAHTVFQTVSVCVDIVEEGLYTSVHSCVFVFSRIFTVMTESGTSSDELLGLDEWRSPVDTRVVVSLSLSLSPP